MSEVRGIIIEFRTANGYEDLDELEFEHAVALEEFVDGWSREELQRGTAP